jgi:hypothetical protein
MRIGSHNFHQRPTLIVMSPLRLSGTNSLRSCGVTATPFNGTLSAERTSCADV